MSFFTGWYEGVIWGKKRFEIEKESYEGAKKIIIAAIKYREFRTKKDYQSETIKKLFNELDKELFMFQCRICTDISDAFDRHFHRNLKKEYNRCFTTPKRQ